MIEKIKKGHPLTGKTSTDKKKKKLSKENWYQDNFTKEGASKSVKADKVEKANIGHLSNKQLRDKLEKVMNE